MWEYFDKIYCINLKEREDRYKSSKKVFDSCNIPVIHFRVDRDKTNPDRGCFQSHVNICKEAVTKRYNRIVIFEDDAVPTKEFTKTSIKRTIKTLKKIPNWDVFYFGCFPDNRYSTFTTPYKNIYKVKGYGAHAYALNTHTILKIASLTWEKKSYDGYLMDSYQHAYLPRLFDQSTSPSSIPRTVNMVNHSELIKKIVLDINEGYAMHTRINVYFLGIFVCIVWIILKKLNFFLYNKNGQD